MDEQEVHDEQIRTIVSAIRSRAESDSRTIIDLRIAVAALEAANRVRSGQASYAGINAIRRGYSSQSGDQPAPRSREAQEIMATEAQDDARHALDRVLRRERSNDDPLAGLAGL